MTTASAQSPDSPEAALGSIASFLYFAVPAIFLAGAYAMASTTPSNISHWLPPGTLRLMLKFAAIPILFWALCVELMFFQGKWIDKFLVWSGISNGAVMQKPLVRFGIGGVALLCAFINGGLLAFYASVNTDFTSGLRIAECLALFIMSLWCAVPAIHEGPTAASQPEGIPATGTQPSENSIPTADAQVVDPARRTYSFQWESPTQRLDSLAGMQAVKQELRATLQGFQGYDQRGTVHDRNGILLSGPPGNGKTTFARAIAGELNLPMVKLACQDITSLWINEGPAMLKELFRQARSQPCVVFFDEFDGVGMRRSEDFQHTENRKLVTALLSEIDNARSHHIVLIAATNYLEQLDPALVREGRFDFRIEIPYPDRDARAAILGALLQRYGLPVGETTVRHVAALWERRSVAFIESTVKRLRDSKLRHHHSTLTVEDFKQASKEASRRSSAIPQTGQKLSKLTLTHVVRQEANSLLFRMKHWEQIAERGGEPPSGVMLYGPPGTGKTHFVRALARELEDWHVFEVNTAEVLQNPRKFQNVMELATTHRPAIVFLDEAEELLRDRAHSTNITATNEILKAMDGLMGQVPEVLFVAATNCPEVLDAAALRSGRFSEKIYMGALEGADLLNFVKAELAVKESIQFSTEVTAHLLAAFLGQATPADIVGLFRKAVNYTFDQDGGGRPVAWADMERAWSLQNFS